MEWYELACLNEVAQLVWEPDPDCWMSLLERRLSDVWRLEPSHEVTVNESGRQPRPVGYWQRVERTEVVQRRPDLCETVLGPIRERSLGFVAWWLEDERDAAHFGQTLCEAALGGVSLLQRSSMRDALVEREFALSACLDKHGFSDGDFFLRDDEQYMAYAHGELCAALRRVGVRTAPSLSFSHHNPFRLFDDGLLKNVGAAEVAALETGVVRLWGFNLELESNPYFFGG